jgi:RimJ/RimL family protein N-acetyltransferase
MSGSAGSQRRVDSTRILFCQTASQSLAAELAVLDIWLYCFRKNEQAVRAYLRAGFVVERAEISDCGNGFYYDDLVMVWRVEWG